jgi:ABC-type bacteriocin/lantibiotic exporter with double-glycine peptidase domain
MSVPLIVQSTQTECGLCASASILGAHGRRVGIHELRQFAEPGRDGLTLRDIRDILEASGMDTKALKVANKKGLQELPLPCILYWNDAHYVVLEKISGKRYKVVDPAVGVRWVDEEEFFDSFSDIVLTAVPNERFEKKRKVRFENWDSRSALTRDTWPLYGLLTVLLLATYGITLLVPIAVQTVIDAFVSPGSTPVGLALTWVGVGLAVFFLLGVARSFVLTKIVTRVGMNIMGRLFTRLLDLPLTYFALRTPGDIIYRLASGDSVRDFLSSRLTEFIMNIGTCLVLLGFLVTQSLSVAGAAVVILAAMGLLMTWTRPVVARTIDAELAMSSEAQVTQLDAVNSIAAVKMSSSREEVLGAGGRSTRRP